MIDLCQTADTWRVLGHIKSDSVGLALTPLNNQKQITLLEKKSQ
jgi:hypothetical protein